MKKLYTIATILILFLIVSLICINKENYFEVLEVYSSQKVAIDLNKNKEIEPEEIFEFKLNTPNFSNKTDKFVYDYFSKEYSSNLLKHCLVKFNKDKTDIFIDKESYVKSFNNQDFSKIDTKNLRILNLKSNKYHYIDCEYGQQAHNYVIVTKSNLPKDSKECKFCAELHKNLKNKNNINTATNPTVVTDLGDIKMYLTDLTAVTKPDSTCSAEPCKNLVKEIASAKTSIDMALYGYNNIPKVQQALTDAKNRGVRLRLVYDLDKNKASYYKNNDILTKLATSNTDHGNSNNSSMLMHNKFFIIDGKTVLTGSMNISPSDLSGFNSNVFFHIESEKIANLFTQEFEQMLSGKFHQDKFKIADTRAIKIGNTIIKAYFSPKDNIIVSQIIPLINNSKKSILIPTFVLTHNQLFEALVAAKARGVEIRMILDAGNASNTYSKHELLRKHGIKVKTENYAGKMHSKSIIIDEKIIIAGSMNLSKSGEIKNDENVLIIENPQLAKQYAKFFNYLWDKIPDKWLKLNARAESKDSIGSCSDKVDNDFDGKIDSEDTGCN